MRHLLLGSLVAAALAGLGCDRARSLSSDQSLSSKTTPQTLEGPKTEVPKASQPRLDTPRVDSPKVDASKPDAPRVEAPKVDAPKADVPKTDLIDKTPIKADVSKIKFTTEHAELFGFDEGESRAFFYTNGLGEVVVKVPADGDYEIVVTASCTAAKGENAKFKLKVDGTQVGAETQLKSEDAKDYTFTSTLKAGDRKIGTEFTNDTYKEGEYDLNFFLNGLRVSRVK